MNGLVMEGEAREMQEFISAEDASSIKNGLVKTSREVDGGSDGDTEDGEHRGSSWNRCWMELCSGSCAQSLKKLKRYWFVGEVIHLTRLAVPLVSSMLSTNESILFISVAVFYGTDSTVVLYSFIANDWPYSWLQGARFCL